MKAGLKELGLPIMKIKEKEVSPVIVTVELPENISSLNVGASLAINNIFIHYKSSYLLERNIRLDIEGNWKDKLKSKIV